MVQEITRRDVGQLLVLGLAALGVAQILRKARPIGRDVSTNETAKSLLQDRSSPSLEVERPTLTMVVFTDYKCPACKLANAPMDSAVQDDGHVRLVYRDWPIFGAISEWTARVAIASDRQGIYAKVHRQLMNERRALNESVVREAVEKSEGSWTQIIGDLQRYGEEIDNQLDRNRRDAFQLGISGTPTYIAGPIIVTGAQDEAGFRQVFAAGREASEKTSLL